MLGETPRVRDPACLLLVRGGELSLIRVALERLGATVEILAGDDTVNPASGSEHPGPPDLPARLLVGPLVVDEGSHEVWLAGRRLNCTVTEFGLLACLARRPGQVFSRRQLLTRLRESAEYLTERTVDTHIGNLRRKLGADAGSLIETVFGVGYKLRAQPHRLSAVTDIDEMDGSTSSA